MPRFTKDGLTVETDYAPEIVSLRAQGFVDAAKQPETPKPKSTN